jgi:hypothetical protein
MSDDKYLDLLNNLTAKKTKPFYNSKGDKIDYKGWAGDKERLLSEKIFAIKHGTKYKQSGYLVWSGNYLRIASNLMKYGIQNKDPEASIEGFELYNAMGLANRDSVKKRLIKAIISDPEKKYLDRAKELIENVNKHSSNLENKVVTSVFGILAVAGLFFGFSSLTGAVIGFSKSFSLPIGVLLFVLGILGLFFGRRL